MTPFLQAKVPFVKELLSKAHHEFILDKLKRGPLVSIDQLCDDDCIAIFIKFDVKILKNNNIIVTGTLNNHYLWHILVKSLTSSPPPKIQRNRTKNVVNGGIHLQQRKKETAQYLSGYYLNSTPSTLLCVIRRNYFQSWPGMTTNLIAKHFPKFLAKAKEHLDQEQKNLRSTKLPPSAHEEDSIPAQQ